ncbi:MAG TPA: restriction endonuclease subunit S [Clostridiales bacterium]|nr:MAG: hypothetical protein A2Y18_04870 [Clostridiales bacterium GWD2_32_19]HCC07352.1 restriction endonuclease subunit S [Clostridiales bacterium]
MRRMKDSGIEWIGEIPEDWEIARLRFLCDINTGDKDAINAEKEGEYPFYVRSPIVERISTYSYDGEAILIAGDGVGAGKVFHYINGKFDYHQRVYNVHKFKNILGKYLYYYMAENFCKEIEKGNAKSTVDSIRLPMLMNFPIAFGKTAEQQIISDYLDEKCIKIDTTIEKQNAVIEKLKSYKQSLITEAVTKGLDKTARMKDSGIEWIGEIPEWWEVRKMKFMGELSSNGVDKKIQVEEPLYKSIHYMDVYRNSIKEIYDSEEYLIVSANVNKAKCCNLEKGDVLFTNSSETPNDIGHCTVIKDTLPNTLFGYHLMRFRPNIKMCLEYEKYLFGAFYLRNWFCYRANGMTRYGLSGNDFSDAVVPLPKSEEQQVIADYLDNKCNKIDKILVQKQKLIEKLETYKKSLIYEAVTGKIEIK